MCKLENGFKLCSCGKRVIPNNFITRFFYSKKRTLKYPDMKPNTWHLFSQENETWLDGTLMHPEEYKDEKEAFIKKYKSIADNLNTKNCFDFSYSPKLDDMLVLCLKDKSTVSFMYEQGWYLISPGTNSLRQWDQWLLNDGVIK